MAQKWTEERRKRFKATMAAKHEPKIKTIEELPVVEVSGRNNDNHGGNGYDAEFAAAFAAAWKVYKGL